MTGMHRRMSRVVTMLTLAALVLTGCTSEASNIGRAQDKGGNTDVADTGFTLSTVGSYDSADTAVVLSTDLDNKAVSFVNMDTGRQYTLYYDGTTYVKDKYDGPMTISQIKPGDVVDVTFLKGKKKLASIKKSPEAWVYNDVYNYDLTGINGTASIGTQTYSMQAGAVVLSEGTRVDKAEVVSQDVVTISGIDHEIYSVNVEKGHGYLSLKNEQPLLGGWIEVGNSIIRQITEDMLLVVPEGNYQVVLSNKNVGCVKEVTVERDKEVVLDVSDLEVAEDAVGKILFTVEPESAKVSVDGKPVDISRVVELKYGIHQIQAEANGYDTLTKHIQVGSEYASISFKLEESRKSSDKDSVSNNSADRIPWKDTMDSVNDNNKDSLSSNTLSSVSDNALKSSQNGKVDVKVKDWDTGRELEKVTVRLEMEDSNKKVISTRTKEAPCSFAKDKNAHKYRFILSKDGYETKTYESSLESYRKDETVYLMLKKKTSSSSDEGIKSSVVAAIASAASTCILTNGPDAYIHIDAENMGGHLEPAGVEKVETAITKAVTDVVGSDGIKGYKKFEVVESLKDVKVVPETGDYQGTTSVTVERDGYKDETIPVTVVIKNYVVTISQEPAEVRKYKPGEEITFSAAVTDSKNAILQDPTIRWEINRDEDEGKSSTEIDTNGKLVIGADESASKITVTATYLDGETPKGVGKAVVPISKITVEITQPKKDDKIEIGNGVPLEAEVKQDGSSISSDELEWEVKLKGESEGESHIEKNEWTPQKAEEFIITATYIDRVGEKEIPYSSEPVTVKVVKPNQQADQAGLPLPAPTSPADDTKVSDDSPGADTQTPGGSPAADAEAPDDPLPADSEELADPGTDGSEQSADSPQTDLGNGDDDSDTTTGAPIDTDDNTVGNQGSGTEKDNGGEAGDGDAEEEGLKTETVTISKEAHPIRKWFSSLFK